MGKNPSLYGTGLPQYSPQHVNMVMQSAISPVLFSTPVKIMNLSSSYRGIMMTAGLKSVSMPVSRLLSCLGIKQCHWGDGSKQPGFLAWGSTAQPCLAAARVQWGKEQDGCVPTGLSSKPSAPTGLPGAGECHPLGHKRDTQAVSWHELEHEPYTQSSSSASHWSASSLPCVTSPAPKGFISWSRQPAQGPLACCHHSHPISWETRVLGR